MPTVQQIEDFKRKARAQGFTEIQIANEVARKIKTDAGAQGSGLTQTTSTAKPTKEKGFFAQVGETLIRPLVDYGKFVGESAYQGIRAATSDITKVGSMNKDLDKLIKQNQDVLKRAKNAKDPEEKKRLLQESRDISAQIEGVGTRAQKVGEMKPTALLEEKDIATRGKIVETGLRRTAGAAAYAVPGGVGVKGALKAGAAAGALAAAGKEGTGLTEIGTGAITGAAFGTIMGLTTKALKSMAGQKLAKTLKDKADDVAGSTYVKAVGGKPLKSEGGKDLLGRMGKIGIEAADPEKTIEQASRIVNEDGNLVYEATRRLAKKGKSIPATELVDFLEQQLKSAKSSVTRQPIKEVLDIVKDDLGGQANISLDDLYLLKTEYGSLGNWNSMASAVEKKKAEIWRDVYIKANNVIDDALTAGGFKDFRTVNERVHTAIQAMQYAGRVGNVAPNKYALGLYDWVAGVGGAAMTGDPTGMVGAVAGKKIIESKAAAGLLTKILSKAGDLAAKVKPVDAQLPQSLANLANIGITSSLVGGEQDQEGDKSPTDQTFQESNQDGSSVDTSIDTTIPEQKPSNIFGGMTKQEFLQNAFMQGANNKQLDELEKIYDRLVPEEEAATLELSDSAIKNVTDLQGAISDVSSLTQEIGDSNIVGVISGLRAKNPLDADARALQAEIDRVRQVVGKALEGGVLRKEDEEKYKKILPVMTDSKEVALRKLKQLDAKLKLDIKNYVEAQRLYGKGRGAENILNTL